MASARTDTGSVTSRLYCAQAQHYKLRTWGTNAQSRGRECAIGRPQSAGCNLRELRRRVKGFFRKSSNRFGHGRVGLRERNSGVTVAFASRWWVVVAAHYFASSDALALEPMITYGTNPAMAGPGRRAAPANGRAKLGGGAPE